MKQKKETTTTRTSSEEWLLGGVLQKSFPKNYTKFIEKFLCSLSNTFNIKASKPSGLQLY